MIFPFKAPHRVLKAFGYGPLFEFQSFLFSSCVPLLGVFLLIIYFWFGLL